MPVLFVLFLATGAVAIGKHVEAEELRKRRNRDLAKFENARSEFEAVQANLESRLSQLLEALQNLERRI